MTPTDSQLPQPTPDPPRVSVVIVTRNQARALRRCLEALSKSTLAAKTEVFVVDNASTDGSNVIQDDFEAVTYLKLPKNFGWTKAANIALRSTQAESILFLDPRVELAPGAVEAMANEVNDVSDAAAVCPALESASGAPAAFLRKLPTPGEIRPAYFALSELPGEPLAVEFPGAVALLIRKAFLKGMNFLDERYGELWSDAEIAAQVRRAGRKILMLPGARGTFHPEDSAPALKSSLLEADFEQGAATFLSKHHGGGIGRRVRSAAGALATLQLGLLVHLVSGQKVDGTQE
ncbi:MAG: glycosyltransferase [Acidobacteria bacterium]|nr:glycosyltransferase [Acidobacteriota bacterium]